MEKRKEMTWRTNKALAHLEEVTNHFWGKDLENGIWKFLLDFWGTLQ